MGKKEHDQYEYKVASKKKQKEPINQDKVFRPEKSSYMRKQIALIKAMQTNYYSSGSCCAIFCVSIFVTILCLFQMTIVEQFRPTYSIDLQDPAKVYTYSDQLSVFYNFEDENNLETSVLMTGLASDLLKPDVRLVDKLGDQNLS